MLEKDGEDQLDGSCEKCRITDRVKKKRNSLPTVNRRRANWIGHILRRNYLLKHADAGKTEGRIKVTGRR